MSAAALRRRLEDWAADWARRRQGRDPAAVTLQRRRIYILPTRYGLVFALLVFAMLLGSMNYATSLGFALTFLLAGFGLVVMHHCHNNLLGARLRFAGAEPVFAGSEARFRVRVENEGTMPRYEIELRLDAQTTGPVDIEPGGHATLRLAVPAARRGWLHLPRFSVATRHPGNLCRAWTWIHMDGRCLVYPAPAPPGRPAPRSADRAESGSATGREAGNADFAGLRAATAGDPPARIAWKAFARNDELLLKQFTGAERPTQVFAWEDLGGLDGEQRLSQLARWCIDACAAGRRFGLRLPGGHGIELGNGEQHLAVCLEALALFELADDRRRP